MERQDTSRNSRRAARPASDARDDEKRLVITHLDDSWSSLADEAALIDRWFGADIADLFGEEP